MASTHVNMHTHGGGDGGGGDGEQGVSKTTENPNRLKWQREYTQKIHNDDK